MSLIQYRLGFSEAPGLWSLTPKHAHTPLFTVHCPLSPVPCERSELKIRVIRVIRG